ncbi:alpha/beta hydrolase [Shewanella sp. cp20]|uniref:alpha/beta hydrolase n=1 Tax=Shewanella sp. cp20 TaxID=1521167 RepID=UPI000AD0D3F2|nr:alpha/beta hydrolase-fold protein [Shewanella sp. cp20]
MNQAWAASPVKKSPSSADAHSGAKPIIAGHEFSHDSSQFKAPRRYMVSLPEGYYGNARRYPVLYVVDADFQFQHVSALALHLARMGKLAPMIVVGIANQGQGDYLYSTTWKSDEGEAFGGADIFYRYLTTELVPTIDGQFRTNPHKALAGYSMGGLFTLYAMTQANSPFDAYLAMSPSVWYDKMSYIERLDERLKQGAITAPLFLTLANEQEMGVDELVSALKGYDEQKIHWQFKHYPDENHFTTALPALYDGLLFLSPDYGLDGGEMLALGDYRAVLDDFAKRKANWAGFHIEWLQAYQFAKYLFWSKQLDRLDEVLQAVKAEFPDSLTMVTVQVAKGFNIKGQAEKAKATLDSVAKQGEASPYWHREMSLYYQGMGDEANAKRHQDKALALAEEYRLNTWELWELQ